MFRLLSSTMTTSSLNSAARNRQENSPVYEGDDLNRTCG